ncbi:MAG: hypothetical protein ACRDKA_09295 [Actinomycetota bacterium]
MTSKRRRRAARRKGVGSAKTPSSGEANVPERRGARGSSARAGAASVSPFPLFAPSMARGLWALGAAPVTLVSAFLSLLATWAVFVALGVETAPRFLAVVMAISPAHLFTDVPVVFGTGGGLMTVVGTGALGLVRALTFAMLTLLLLGWLEDGRPDLRAAVRRLPRSAAALFAIYVVEVGLVFVLLQVAAGFLGPLSLLIVVAALYFLAFVPVVAVVEGASVQEAFRRGFRAARLPGTRHLTLVMIYFLLLFYAASVSPFGAVTPATPSVLTWVFAMIVTAVHIGVLGSLVYRWLIVRDQVSAEPTARARSR